MVSKFVPGVGEVGYIWNSADKLIGVDFPDGSFTRFFYRHDGLRYRRVDSDGGFMVFIKDKYAKRRGRC
jgi:YD repeat-containing protein